MYCPISADQPFACFVAHSVKMKNALANGKKFAKLDMPLLIQGETGTGKDLMAKACHYASSRCKEKFVAVNCAGLPTDDAESEMFGHFSPQKEHIVFFEYANGGTILLDGVAELPLNLQGKLLRFLNDGSFRRVGEEKEHYADVRVICTSQLPLVEYVSTGKMRSDLFHRLNVLTLTMPPLRERLEDMAELTQLFLKEICKQLKRKVPSYDQKFIDCLTQYNWPGNVRELYNQLYSSCCLMESGKLTPADLRLPPISQFSFHLEQFEEQSLEEIVKHFEMEVLRQFYAQYPSTRKLAQRLGMSHTAIANKLRAYGISK